MQIIGVGIDLSMTEAFRKTLAERKMFLHQFCTVSEMREIEMSTSPVEHANCIFAIKEAVGKAFGTGLVEEFWFDAISVSFGDGSVGVSISTDALAGARKRFNVRQIGIAATCCRTPDFTSATCVLSGSP